MTPTLMSLILHPWVIELLVCVKTSSYLADDEYSPFKDSKNIMIFTLGVQIEINIIIVSIYASLSSGDAYSDRQLTLNIELWDGNFLFCVPTWFHMRIPKSCLSVPREKKSPYLREYQSYNSNWYINGKVFTSTTALKPKNMIFFFKSKLNCAEKLKSP